METVVLKTPSTEGKIYVGADAIEARLPDLTAGRKCFVVADEKVYGLCPDFFEKWFYCFVCGFDIFINKFVNIYFTCCCFFVSKTFKRIAYINYIIKYIYRVENAVKKMWKTALKIIQFYIQF